MADNCIMCGKSIPEGRQVCWSCEFKIMQKCKVCILKDTATCLKMECWRVSNYDTERVEIKNNK